MGTKILRKFGKNLISANLANDLGLEHVIVLPNGRLSKESALIGPNDILINYGVGGNRWFEFLRNSKKSTLDYLRVINPWEQLNKFQWIERAKEIGIDSPKSVQSFKSITGNSNDWIAKPYYSRGGYGITLASENKESSSHYYQQLIKNRKYELRITFFSWVPIKNWFVWKKIMRDEDKKNQIAWNHRQGGSFIPIKNPNGGVFDRIKKASESIIKNSFLSFGASDFIVDRDGKEWFIEVNTSPGFSDDINKERYVSFFKSLLEKNIEEQFQFTKTVVL